MHLFLNDLKARKEKMKKNLLNYFTILKFIRTFAYSNTYLFIFFVGRILNISEAASIALHSMGVIARSKELLNVQQISGITGYSRNHTAKVLQQLVRNNLLTSARGPKGGFLLREKASDVSLMDIYRVIEGDINIEDTLCKVSCELCPFRNCIFGGLNEKFSREFRKHLQTSTLASV